MKGIHFYAGPQPNSGDFFLGPATKWDAENKLGTTVEWANYDVRARLDTSKIQWMNANFDVMVLGGGGLLLPDTNPNMESCWQWPVPSQLIPEIKIPIYVIGLGYNLFYGQKITMPERGSNNENPIRELIFKQNLQTLINHSTYFSMRHRGDIECLVKIIGEEYRSKIIFQLCPVLEYVKSKYRYTVDGTGEYHTFEIKDDRQFRRYDGTSIEKVYNYLKEYIQFLIQNNKSVGIMSHDGSVSFYNFLKRNGISVPLFDNTSMDEEKIIDNYRKVKRLYCTAGHSQMMAHALGIDYYSLVGHDKLEYFLKDLGKFDKTIYSYINDPNLLKNLIEGV